MVAIKEEPKPKKSAIDTLCEKVEEAIVKPGQARFIRALFGHGKAHKSPDRGQHNDRNLT